MRADSGLLRQDGNDMPDGGSNSGCCLVLDHIGLVHNSYVEWERKRRLKDEGSS